MSATTLTIRRFRTIRAWKLLVLAGLLIGAILAVVLLNSGATPAERPAKGPAQNPVTRTVPDAPAIRSVPGSAGRVVLPPQLQKVERQMQGR